MSSTFFELDPRLHFESPYAGHDLVRFCDLRAYDQGAKSSFDYHAKQLLALGTGADPEKQTKLEQQLVEDFYQEILQGQFEAAYEHSLFKGEKKQKNPFYDRYATLGSGAIEHITPLGDHRYEVKNTMTYCRRNSYEAAGDKHFTDELLCGNVDLNTHSSYKAVKAILIREGKVYIDHQESKEITKKRVCDKVVEDTRRSLKNVLVKKQGEWDSEPFWYFRDDAHVGELKVCSDYINHSTFSED